GLLAYARHAYDPETNTVIAMFSDGTRLTPEAVKRPGYYNRATFEPRPGSPLLMLSYAVAYRLTRDAELWKTVRAMARGIGLVDIEDVRVETNSSDPIALFAMIELHRATDDPAFLDLADA